jgi:hypothetical protein
MRDAGYEICDLRCEIWDTRFQIPDAGYGI